MGRLAGKNAVVTGGARGIGAAIARMLIDEGASVAIADLLSDEGEHLASTLGPRARYVKCDVTSSESWDEALASAEDAFGPVNVLVNNAGVVQRERIENLSESDYRRVIDVNQVAVFLGMRAVLPSMRRAKGGSIVNISSIEGIVAAPEIIAYVASKWAVRGMTKAAAQEFGADGIRVNSVHPGVVETPMTIGKPGIDMMVQGLPVPRMGRPEEISSLVTFLASDESGYCTGTEFVADGGYTSR
ncbi:SDR family NAD(P)-dependent oxidoreductase [Hoyosella altamirensis]|uniref:3alpha(Or 20beta)-hydroxysteroid dehydrogenase n=1 Tax=Hoyosella altamirensis TaxID=616997 RepID=A0A839RQF7_9ACTN|nr:glucose 1-dehydrogenase [Hoyosella altamirensis]MBB3039222.1 3alpha(or 20beta)-hydroxysteroid dehydrogenase [Hoyosella altamirensis]